MKKEKESTSMERIENSEIKRNNKEAKQKEGKQKEKRKGRTGKRGNGEKRQHFCFCSQTCLDESMN